MKAVLSSLKERAPRFARTLTTLLTRRSDTAWWGENQNLSARWDERTRLIAGLVPVNSVVLEFGAGQQNLKQWLPPGCRYLPSDLVLRTPETLVCDLNARPLPDLSAHGASVTVLSGVLEYVFRIDEVASWLARTAPTCIVSYCPAKVRFPGERTLKRALRAEYGWVNTLTADEFAREFERAGFRGGPSERWREHLIYRFERADAR